MSVTIEENPFPLDFAGNRCQYRIRCTPYSNGGRRSVSVFKIGQMPGLGYSLTVTYGETTLTMIVTVAYNKRDDPNFLMRRTEPEKIKAELEKKVARNYEIAQLYDVTVSDELEIVFTSKEAGGDSVTITSNDTNAIIDEIEQVAGITPVARANYGVTGWLELQRYANGSVSEERTPEFQLHPDSSGRVKVPLDILRPYFTQCDIPPTGEAFDTHQLLYALLKYRLVFADRFGTPPQVQSLQYSDWRLLSAGTVREDSRKRNLPDWLTSDMSVPLSHYKHIRNYGSTNGLTVRCFAGMPQYAYFILFDTESGPGLTRDLEVDVKVMEKSGNVVSLGASTFPVKNLNIVRLPLSSDTLRIMESCPDAMSYTVTCTEGAAFKWRRTFLLERKPLHGSVFLLQNRLGVLESLLVENELAEKETAGDEVVRDGGFEIAVTDSETTFTARTGYRSREELQLLADAAGNANNYKLENGNPVPITILPDTLTVADEAEDLQSVEFRYRHNLPQDGSGEPVPTGLIITEADYWVELDASEQAVRWDDAIQFGYATNLITAQATLLRL